VVIHWDCCKRVLGSFDPRAEGPPRPRKEPAESNSCILSRELQAEKVLSKECKQRKFPYLHYLITRFGAARVRPQTWMGFEWSQLSSDMVNSVSDFGQTNVVAGATK
jgi:hypothetical protein